MKRFKRLLDNRMFLKVFAFLSAILIPLHTANAAWQIVDSFFRSGIGSFLGGIAALLLTPITTIAWLIAVIGSVVVSMAGKLLDLTLTYAVLTPIIGDPAIVAAINAGWTSARDIANLFFIFILLYIAIATILRVNESGTKRMLASVIIIALLMNFSLFFTKVVFDVSNTIAVGTWSSLYQNTGSSPSEKMANAAQLSKILDQTNLLNLKIGEAVKAIITFLMVAAIFGVTTWVFLNAVFLLLGRLIAFIFLMIVAPFAFISYILPKTRGKVFDKWLDMLINQAMVAPIFIFLFLIVSAVLASGPGGTSPFVITTGNPIDDSVLELFNYLIVIALIYGVLKITRDVSGNVGKMATGFGKMATGFVAGGVGGLALRNTVGRGAKRLAKSNALQGNNPLARRARKAAERTARGGMDFRDVPGVAGSEAGKGFGKSYSSKAGERRKKEKERKEAADADTISNNNAQLQNIPNPAAANTIMNGLSPQEVAKLDPGVLASSAVAQNLDVPDLMAMMNNKDLNLSRGHRAAIRAAATPGSNADRWLNSGAGAGF